MGGNNMPKKVAGLQELLVDQLQDLYDAEKQLVRALPKMAKAASDEELANAFREHLEVTKGQVQRIEQVFESLEERAKSKPCKGMKGIVEEGNEVLQEGMEEALLDSAMAGAGRKVEHYEMMGYESVSSLARQIGRADVVELLQQTLREEMETDKLLAQISKRLLKEASSAASMQESGGEEEEGGGSPGGSRGRGGSKSASSRSGSGQASKSSGGGSNSGSRGGSSSGKSSGSSASKRSGGSSSAKRSGGSSSKGSGGGASSGSGARGSKNSRVLTYPEEIRQWAEERGARPACVQGTGGKGDVGMIRLEFGGPFGNDDKLQEISWDDWSREFQDRDLALIVQEKTARGQKSNFNKLISKQTAEESGGKGKTRAAR
jgi:ferritin-like metal-binding protein YciE